MEKLCSYVSDFGKCQYENIKRENEEDISNKYTQN